MIDRLRGTNLWVRQEATWSRARLRFAAMAVATAVITAAFMAATGPEATAGAVLYVLVTLGALFFPAGITFQVMAGLVLAGRLLLESDGTALIPVALILSGIVLTAELLAVVARLDSPLWRDPSGSFARALMAAGGAALVAALVLLVSELPGPAGLLAAIVAALACGAMAARLVRQAPWVDLPVRRTRPPDPPR